MKTEPIEIIASKIVAGIFGQGYISHAAMLVFNVSVSILSQIPESERVIVAENIIEMCREVALESAQVGFE